jgi:hypothetical protein
MADRGDWEQPPQYPEQGYGQQYPRDQPWQPQPYNPSARRQRIGWQQYGPRASRLTRRHYDIATDNPTTHRPRTAFDAPGSGPSGPSNSPSHLNRKGSRRCSGLSRSNTTQPCFPQPSA